MKQPLFLASAVLAALTLSGAARADGGYFEGVKGAHASGRGGAFTARADDVSAVELNPAGLAHIDTTIVTIGNRFSYNERTYQRNPTLDWAHPNSNGAPPYVTFAKVKNKTPWQALDPLIGIASNLGLKDWGFGFAVYSPAGTAREVYPDDGGQRYMMVRRNAQIIDYNLSAAWKFHELFGVGASLQWIAVPTLEYGLVIDGDPFAKAGNPVSSDYDINARVKGQDLFTLNAILGAWVRPTPNFEFGVSGQVLPSEIDTKSKLSVNFVTPKGDSVTLVRNNAPANDVTLSLPLPMTARLGARYRYLDGDREVFDVEVDGVYETWSRVNRFRLDSNGIVAQYQKQFVNVGVIDIAKNWRDTFGIHVGGDVSVVPKVATVRAGVYYETPVADPSYSNIDFTDGPEFGGAVGGSVNVGKVEISAAAEYRAQATVYVADSNARVYQQVPGSTCTAPYADTSACNAHYLGVPSPPVNGGTYNAYSVVATLEATYRF
ncbi:MAG TPA: outer membrane protein transport protein [Polyangiaceae bacterium]|nr:outer membrane protein transport protein [Polyangiaceae bacterium]